MVGLWTTGSFQPPLLVLVLNLLPTSGFFKMQRKASSLHWDSLLTLEIKVMFIARDQNQSPSWLCSAVACVSNAINSVKGKEMLSCSAVILCHGFDATFDSWKIQRVLRGSRVIRSWSLHFPLPSQGGPCFQESVTAHRGIEPCTRDFALEDQEWFLSGR